MIPRMWPTSTHCQRCKARLTDYMCFTCGGPNPEPDELEVIQVHEQEGLWVELYHVMVGNEYNHRDPITLSEDGASRLRDQLDYVLRERRLPSTPVSAPADS